MKKNFSMGVGKFCFNVRNGQQNIMIMRNTFEEASYAFLNYKDVGKDCEWLGCYNGKNFDKAPEPTNSKAKS